MAQSEILNKCQECGAKCCKLGGTDFTFEEMKRVLDKGYSNYFIELDENHYELECKEGVCPYLKSDLSCEIHDVRPLLCSRWPVYTAFLDKKRINLLMKCGITDFLLEKDIIDMKMIASKISDEFILTSVNSSLCSDIKMVSIRFDEFDKQVIDN